MGIFVGYSEKEKSYRIYILGFRQIKINRDVTFDEDASFTKSRKILAYEDHEEEKEAPRTTEVIIPPVKDIEESPIQEDHDLAEPQGLIETAQKMISTKIRPSWDHDVIKEAERYGAPKGSKIQRIHSNYVALMRNIVDEQPTYFD